MRQGTSLLRVNMQLLGSRGGSVDGSLERVVAVDAVVGEWGVGRRGGRLIGRAGWGVVEVEVVEVVAVVAVVGVMRWKSGN